MRHNFILGRDQVWLVSNKDDDVLKEGNRLSQAFNSVVQGTAKARD